MGCAGLAEPVRAPGQIAMFADRKPLFDGATVAPQTQSASLFSEQPQGGLFAPRPQRLDTLVYRPNGTVASRLRDLIASAEAGRAGYDAVQHGARIKPSKFPTQMTIGEIYAWIKATPGQPHAIGRYQFIPATLRQLVNRAGLDPRTRFSPQVQDQLGDLLLADAGLAKVQTGKITQRAFMLNLAKIWAGLPTPSGRSYYHGYAGNKATMSYDSYIRQVQAILAG